MRKNKLLLLLALLMTAVTGAWATTPNSIVINGTPQVGDKSISLTYHFDPNNVPGLEAFAPTLKVKCAADNKWDEMWLSLSDVSSGTTNISLSNLGEFEAGKTYEVCFAYNNGNWVDEVFQSFVPAGPSAPKHLITATYREQTRLLEQPLPYATTIGELFEAVTGEHFSDLISTMSAMEMPLTGISSNNTSVVSIGELNGASTQVTVIADGEATVSINFSGYPLGILVSAISPLYANMKDGVKDADKWTVKVGDGQAQALPIGGLKGDGSETVTLQYNGRLKVKGVKATSEAAPAEEPVADIVWDVTNISDLYVSDGGPYEKEGVTMSSNSGNVSAMWNNYNDPTQDGISFDLYEYGGYTFTAPTGKAFTKIEMTALASAGWETSNLGTGWAFNNPTVTWTGSAASTVDLLKDADEFYGAPVNSIAFYLSEPAAKEPATVTTAPTGAAIVGVGKTTALVSGGVADGGTLMYKVQTTNTKPTSTDGFSDAVPTAKDITASGKVYVWYYVKGDDTHSDSEIAATAIEVPVADIVWDVTNVSDISVEDPSQSYEKEGVTLSANAENIFAGWNDTGDPTTDGISFQVYGLGGFTFTAPAGKAFTKIEMNALGYSGWDEANLGSGWAYFEDDTNNIYKVTWTGSAASTDKLLPLTEDFVGENVISIGFTLSDAE